MATLVIFMAVDFITGFISAAMEKSKHSLSGGLNSKA
jgi:archaellum component FlaG (FlaF/FlaG flagellin family)